MASARTAGLCIARHSTSATCVHIDNVAMHGFVSSCELGLGETTSPDVGLFSEGRKMGSSAIICRTVSRLLLTLPFINRIILTLPALLCSSTVTLLPLGAISAGLLAFTAVSLCGDCRLCSRVGFRVSGIVRCAACIWGGGGCLVGGVGRVIKACLGLQRY